MVGYGEQGPTLSLRSRHCLHESRALARAFLPVELVCWPASLASLPLSPAALLSLLPVPVMWRVGEVCR